MHYRSRNGSTDSSRSQTYGSRARTSTSYTPSYTPSFALSYGKTKPEEPKELMSRNSSQESLRDADKQPTSHAGVSSVPKNPSIRESSQERDPDRHRKRSSKERTARRNSRQRALTHSSSSDEEIDRSLTRADAKRRRRRHRESAEQVTSHCRADVFGALKVSWVFLQKSIKYHMGQNCVVLKSLDSSLNKTGSADDSKSTATRAHPPVSPVDFSKSASPSVPCGPVSVGSIPSSGPVHANPPMIVVPVLASPSVSPSPDLARLSAPPGAITASPSPPPRGANFEISRSVMKTMSPPKFFKINNLATPFGFKPVTGNASTSEDVSLATKSDATLKNSRANSSAGSPVKNAMAPAVAPPQPPPKVSSITSFELRNLGTMAKVNTVCVGEVAESNDSGSLDGFTDSEESGTDASSIIDDESQYSAVVHFKPNKPKVKRIAPVPGLWKVEGADEFISKNKRLVREPHEAAVTQVWKVRPRETAIKRLRVPRTPVVKKPEPKKPIVTVPVENNDKREVKFSGITKDEKVEEKSKKVVEENKKEGKKFEAPVVRIEKKTPPPQRKNETIPVVEPKEKNEEKAGIPEVQQKKEVELKGLKVVSKPAVQKEEKVQTSAILRSQASRSEGVAVILVQPIL
ncbi:hypothetical protein TELCIR_02507 [Teladorsagia circumcincta]|uniref:Uncharacterized protein n=1 Tax=Teladorsagia circumcincta TaxID=45464 RepID=A0A2G9UYY7_TELCI|nr:hypothetical protein TELCIR_02507 [Teladorsagia circumcincta]